MPAPEADTSPEVVASTVVRAKVERELEHWRSNEASYRRRGWLLLAHAGTTVDVGFAASVPLVTGPLDLIACAVRFDFSDFDLSPPSVRFIDPLSGADRMPPTRALLETPDGPRDLIVNDHPKHHRPFLCVPGTREYHEHPQHSGDMWLLHRSSGAGRLAPLCDLLWRTMAQNVVGVVVGVQALPPPVGFQVQFQVAQGDRRALEQAVVEQGLGRPA